MKNLAILAVTLILLTLLLIPAAWCSEKSDTRRDVLYTCACGDSCKCGSVSTEPGNCSCGKPLKWHHALKVEGDTAVLCNCDEGCKCSPNKDDPNKCSCGKSVSRVSLKGRDIYFCNCGGSCSCNTFSNTPGDCGCGMKLKKE